jgi:hypothetical protein
MKRESVTPVSEQTSLKMGAVGAARSRVAACVDDSPSLQLSARGVSRAQLSARGVSRAQLSDRGFSRANLWSRRLARALDG